MKHKTAAREIKTLKLILDILGFEIMDEGLGNNTRLIQKLH